MADTFYDQYLQWAVRSENIHEHINQWKNDTTNQTLHEHLGLTEAEYLYWEKNQEKENNPLETIREARGRQLDINDMQISDETPVLWVLYRGTPMDSGFGDRGEIIWECDPIIVNGNIVWFDEEKTAEEAAKQLTDESWEHTAFERYSGNFPVEYEARKMITPLNEKSDSTIVSTIIDMDKPTWKLNEDY